MTGQEFLRNLQDDIDRKKGKFIELMREFHSKESADIKMQDNVEKARIEWLISINHLKASLPFLGTKELVHSLVLSDKKIDQA